MLLIASTCFGMAPKGSGGLRGMTASAGNLLLSEEHPPCGPGNECTRETILPERLTTPPQPEPTDIELPALVDTPGSSCKECTRISEGAAAHIVTATMARCLQRCEARKREARSQLATVNEEIQKLQAQQLAQNESQRQREELTKYHELLQQATALAGGQPSAPSFSAAQSALAQAQKAREQLQQQNQQLEGMRKTINELRAQVRANEDPGGGAAEPMGLPTTHTPSSMGPYRFQL